MYTTKKQAFALAEVLITLAIIGIIAALTIPNLMRKYTKLQTVTQLKASYSLLQQAIKLSELENGNLASWDYTLERKAFFEKYLEKYLKMEKKKLRNDNSYKDIQYKWLNGNNISGSYKESSTETYSATLINGSIIHFHSGPNLTTTIMVDINGHKKPNRVGVDLFHFAILPKYGLQPWGYGNQQTNEGQSSFGTDYDRDKIMSASYEYACNKTRFGRWCTALIMRDGWEIKDDYPWDF